MITLKLKRLKIANMKNLKKTRLKIKIIPSIKKYEKLLINLKVTINLNANNLNNQPK